jgi:hypothetical protein
MRLGLSQSVVTAEKTVMRRLDELPFKKHVCIVVARHAN